MNSVIVNLLITSTLSSGVALSILLIRLILGKNTGAWWRSLVWTLLLLRMCFPVMLNTPIGIVNDDTPFDSTNQGVQLNNFQYMNNNLVGNDIDEPIDDVNYTEPITNSSSTNVNLNENVINTINNSSIEIQLLNIVKYIYLFGFLILLFRFIVKLIILQKRVKNLQACEYKQINYFFSDIKDKLGINRPVKLVFSTNDSVPALSGVFRPAVIIPRSILNTTNVKELEHIFIHELTHLKRLDILRLWLIELASCIHWFNPLIYVLKKVIIQDIELACDERVLRKIQKKDYANYGNTLLNFSSKKPTDFPLVATTNFAGKRGKNIKERLIMIKKFNNKKIVVTGVILVLLISVLMVACTTANTNNIETIDSPTEQLEVITTEPTEEATEPVIVFDERIPVIETSTHGGDVFDILLLVCEGEFPLEGIVEEFNMIYLDSAYRLVVRTSYDDYEVCIMAAQDQLDISQPINYETTKLCINSANSNWSEENPSQEFIEDNLIKPYIDSIAAIENQDDSITSKSIYAVYYDVLRKENNIGLNDNLINEIKGFVESENNETIDMTAYDNTDEYFFTTDIRLIATEDNGEAIEIEVYMNRQGVKVLKNKSNKKTIIATDLCNKIINEVAKSTDWQYIDVSELHDIISATITIDNQQLAYLDDISKLNELTTMLQGARCIGYTPKTMMYKPVLELTRNDGVTYTIHLDLEDDLMMFGSSFHYDYGAGYVNGNNINNLDSLLQLFDLSSFDINQ